MKILVPFKRVADMSSGTSCDAVSSEQWVINPFDEIAIEEVLRMRERGEAAEAVGVTIGAAVADEQIRSALARGLDRAIRVDDSRTLDPYAVSRILAAVVRKEKPHLVIMGKQAVDDDANQTGQMLAGLLGWPQATCVSKVELLKNTCEVRCTRETDRGLEIITVRLPAVLTTDLRLNEPRYISLPGLMKARRRPIELMTCDELGAEVRPRTVVLVTSHAPRRARGPRVASVEELLVQLREREKVL